MRITLTIDDDVLSIAKELAARHHKTVGEVISVLARHSLPASSTRNGVPLLDVKNNTPVTMKFVNELYDEPSCS
ncbi:CopG family transcriptional regulator [Phyllobacterium sp. K27]